MASSQTSPQPHAVVMPYPHPGHVTPLVHLSMLLAARSFVITFVTSPLQAQKLLQANQGLDTSGIKLVGIPDGLPETHEQEHLITAEDFLASVNYMHKSFEELVGKMVEKEGPTITCIISDSFLLWTQDVANKWSIPRVSFWPNSLTAFACSISLPKIMQAVSPSLDPFKPEAYGDAGAGEMLYCIPGILQISTHMLPFYTRGGEQIEEWMRYHVQTQMERVNEPLCIISNCVPDLEKEVHTQLQELLPCPPLFTLGPLFLATGQDDKQHVSDVDAECMSWLDTQCPHSVVYISMGSVVALQEREIQEIALGLDASEQPFLWTLWSTPSERVLCWFSEEGRGRGKVIRWASQLRVLSHEAVGGFLTHCGWNSTLETVSKGVPIIAWPQMMDQFTNCWYLVEVMKVGVRLELEEGQRVGRAGVERAIRMLMQEEQGRLFRACASHLPPFALSAVTSSLPSQVDSLVECILSSHNDSLCASLE